MGIQNFIKKNVVSLLAIGVSTTSVALSVAIPGAMGSSGSTGAIGSVGPMGSTGPQGPIGPSGGTGPQGPVGESGSSGVPGQSPYIGSNGNWWIGDIDTGVNVETTGPQGPIGETGASGVSGQTPYIGPNGNWWIGDVDSGITTSTGGFSEDVIPMYPITMTAAETLLNNRVNEFVVTVTNEAQQTQYVQQKIDEDFIPISSANQLFSITDKNGKYVLTQHIDVSTLDTWSPLVFDVGDRAFSGEFDGAGFEIRNLNDVNLDIGDPDDLDGLGLFQVIRDATISNITFKNVDINYYDLPVTPFLAVFLGSLAGIIDNSTLENINLDTVSLLGRHYIGGIAGLVDRTTLHSSEANNVDIIGQSYVGGVFGENSRSSLHQLDYDDIDIFFDSSDQVNYQGHDYFGGVTGSSSLSTYLSIDIDVNIDNIGLIPMIVEFMDTDITRVGGLMGESSYDRLFNVVTTGSITFTPNEEEFYLGSVGGVSGSGFNSTYFNVINTIDISLDMGDEVELMYFVSIGGVIGVASFVNMERAVNEGNVVVIPPDSGIDNCVYFNIAFVFDGGCDIPNNEYPIEYFGGLIGYIEGSAYLTFAMNLGDIIGIAEVGGLIGSSGGGGPFPFFLPHDLIIQQSFNQGNVFGYGFVGGIMGLTDERTNLIVANAYNVGDVAAMALVGGILGLASPALGIEIFIVNTYNAGEIFVNDIIAGGLIGATFPSFFLANFADGPPDFDLLASLFGSIEIHNSFNVGEIINGEFGQIWVSGSVIGLRFIQTRMYSVSYLVQFLDLDDFEFTPEIPFLIGVAEGNNVDLKAIDPENSFLYFDDDRFIYRSAWNFTNVWEWDVLIAIDNPMSLPTLQNTNFLLD